MILMPGFDGTGELFSPLIAALSPHHRPTVIRYRDERTFDDYIDTASAALPERDAILIAESFSGPIALGLMARHAGGTQHLVTVIESFSTRQGTHRSDAAIRRAPRLLAPLGAGQGAARAVPP